MGWRRSDGQGCSGPLTQVWRIGGNGEADVGEWPAILGTVMSVNENKQVAPTRGGEQVTVPISSESLELQRQVQAPLLRR